MTKIRTKKTDSANRRASYFAGCEKPGVFSGSAKSGGPGGPGEAGTSIKLRFALAGNANVGKSVIFNYLTKLHQHIGNWPGKTVERAEGTFHFKGYEIDVIDLPGIYSISTYSIEEVVTREYIAKEKPDVLINVVDASVLERNLFLTLQLMEFEIPMVVVLNQTDMAEKKGIFIDYEELTKALGIPVIPAVAVRGTGIYEAVEETIKVCLNKTKPVKIVYGKEIENSIGKIEKMVKKDASLKGLPARWKAIKLLEEDAEVAASMDKETVAAARKISKNIETIHDHSCPTAMACEKYAAVGNIARRVQKATIVDSPVSSRFADLLLHRIWGYPIMAGIIALVFISLFSFGNFLSGLMEGYLLYFVNAFRSIAGSGVVASTLTGFMEGMVAAVTVVVPYILPFYLILGLLEDSGYLARMAFLMDSAMHKIGLHGKAFIPMIMGFGCNVPACLGCRVMETKRERMLAIFVTSMIPCAAVTAVVLGLVAKYVSLWWAIGLYAIDLLIIFALGKIAFRVLPGESVGLIMEIPDMRLPQFRTTVREAWYKMKDFVFVAFPIIIASAVVINLMKTLGMLAPLSGALYPVTVLWLGLPSVAGIAFVFGIIRKELTLIMLASLFGTAKLAAVMTPVQMLVFTLVTMLYIPCAATIAALVKETGWKKAGFITVFKIFFAILVGGIFMRILLIFR